LIDGERRRVTATQVTHPERSQREHRDQERHEQRQSPLAATEDDVVEDPVHAHAQEPNETEQVQTRTRTKHGANKLVKQLEDDVVYIKRDFGGIGFWPLVVNEPAITEEMPPRCEEMRSVTGCLIRYFQNTTWQGQPDSFINQFVCENRAYFRIAMGLLTVLCLLFTGLYFYSCRIHSRIKNLYILYLFVIVIPTLIVALLLLTFDPVLEPISEGNLPLIIVLFSGVAISIIVYQRRRKHMKKPSRPRIQISQEGSD